MTVERPQLLFPPLSAVSTCSNQQCNDVTILRRLFLHFLGTFSLLFPPCLRSQHGPPYNAARYFLDVSILTFGGTLFLHSPPVSTQSQIVRLLQHALNKNGYYEVVLCGEAVLPIYTNHCTCSDNCTARFLHLT